MEILVKTLRGRWGATELPLGIDEAGRGAPVVPLPGLSSISTRAEMLPLLERLAPRFRVTSVDCPGFGDLAWPPGNPSAMWLRGPGR